MKIRQIPAFRPGSIQDGRNLKISPTLQLLFGYVDADTTAVRDGIRNFFYGEGTFAGLNSERTEFEVTLNSGTSIGTRFVDGVRMRNPQVTSEWNKLLKEIDLSTFRSFFEMNFGQAETSGAQLCFQLNKRFNAPFGEVSPMADEDGGQTEVMALKSSIATVNRNIASIRSKTDQLRSRLEDLESSSSRPYEFEAKQRATLCQRIENLEEKLGRQKEAACLLDDEIEMALRSAVPVHSESQHAPVKKSNKALAEQLQNIDNQIDRWKTTKIDVEGRLTQLKGDLGCSRVSEFDGMLDDMRMINQISETKLLELMEFRNVGEHEKAEYRELLELNHQICDALTAVQDRWREEIANNEIESLTRCSTELDSYLGHLARKRNRLEGSKATQTGNSSCQCKSHLPGMRIDVHHVEQMKLRQAELLNEIEITEKGIQSAHQELNALDSFADSDQELDLIREGIRELNEEHSSLQDDKDRLLNQLRICMEAGQQNSRLIRLMSRYFSELTSGQYQRVYLEENGHDLIVVSSNEGRLRFRDADFVTRNRARMAVSLGCARLLADSGFSIPLVWEDPFIGLETTDVEIVTRVLQEFSRTTSQVLLLTNNRFVKQLFESKSIPCLDLPDRYSGDSYPSAPAEPGRRSNRLDQLFRSKTFMEGPVEYSSTTNWSDINRDFDLAAMDQYGTEQDKLTESRFRSGSGRIQHRPVPSQKTPRVQTSSSAIDERETENLKYYLEMSSRVEAAPTIGPKTAEKLEKIGICSVSDLLDEDAIFIAEQLGQRRIKPEDVSNWQKQALLVCEVPNLRGHDAQLLVACGVDDAIQLAGMEPEPLFEVVGPFAKSKDGKKLLRGSTQPDLDEVRNWVRWARYKNGNRRAA